MLKKLKIPANQLPLSCQKNVQTTSLFYRNVGKENMQKKLSKPAERCIVRKGLFLTCPFFQLYQPPSHLQHCFFAIAFKHTSMDLHGGSGRHLQKNPTEPKKDAWVAEPFNLRSYMSQFSDKTYHIFISQNRNVVVV